MVKWLLTFSLLVLTFQASADVNTNVANCLSSPSLIPGGKVACIQNAIANEGTNQIATLFQIYANGVNQSISYYTSNGGGNTPPSIGGGSGSPGGSSLFSSGSAPSTTVKPKVAPTPSPVASPTPPATQQPAKQAPQNQGGIQYY